VLALLLGPLFGVDGIAASIACGAWSSALALVRRGASTFGFSSDDAARRRLPRMIAAALAMGGLLWLAARFTAPMHGLAQAALLMGLIAAAIAVYGLLLALFGAVRWGDAVGAVRQAKPADLRD
jgi:putative peptidoglycan lipid II flippase